MILTIAQLFNRAVTADTISALYSPLSRSEIRFLFRVLAETTTSMSYPPQAQPYKPTMLQLL
jgi:hypothetical protein